MSTQNIYCLKISDQLIYFCVPTDNIMLPPIKFQIVTNTMIQERNVIIIL